MEELTSDELKLFTKINLVAFALLRQESKEKGNTLPCWLCLSDYARSKAVEDVVPFIRIASGRLDLTREEVAANISANTSEEKLQYWIKDELELKQHRADGNPRAFFAE